MLTAQPLASDEQQRLDDLPVYWVKNDEQLDRLMDEIDQVDIIALDTEFIKRDTFFPRLALLQINIGTAIYLLDVPKLDLYDFWQVIADVPVLVLHACGEDLGIYYLLSELPALTNVFDTQIGLGFLTGELQIGYQKALADVLQIHVGKGESQSDWLQRPLTHEQEEYAADDVRYLLALYDALKQQLTEQQLWTYATEDSLSYAQELYDHNQQPDNMLYLSVADFRYNRQQLAILQTLCEWREQLARATNKPRTFILRPQALKEIAEKPPFSMKQLGFTSAKPNVIRMYGEEILTLVDEVRKADENSYPPLLPLPYRSLSESVQKQLEHAIHQEAERLGIADNVLIRKKWLSELYAYSLDADYSLPVWLLGWRHEWVMAQLLPIMQAVIGGDGEVHDDTMIAANPDNDMADNETVVQSEQVITDNSAL